LNGHGEQPSVATSTHRSADGQSWTFKITHRDCECYLWLAHILLVFILGASGARAESRFVPGQILVRPKAGLSETSFLGKLRNHGALNRRTLHHLNVRVIAVPEAKAESVLAALQHDPEIEFAERDYIAKAAFLPNDPYVLAGDEWHLLPIQAAQAWNITTGLTNTIVAVLDSGINDAHPDLEGQVLPGYDFVNTTNDPADDFGHGTAVSGTIVAAGNNALGVAGVAYAARVLPVKVMDSYGFASYSCIAQGIKYAVDQHARVINISIVGSSPSSTLQDAINYAWSNNVVVVAAAGNNANNVPQYPAACDHVLGVSATEPDDSLASFSSYGSFVTLSAPGDNIWTTQNDVNSPYGTWRGTSFASPLVAGVAALVASENPSLSNTQIVSILEQSADDLGPAGYDVAFGYGRVNAYRAVSAASLEPGALPPRMTAAPTVTLSSPAGSAQFSLGAIVFVTAEVSPGTSSAAVTNVLLLANGEPFANLAAAPFVLGWTPAQPGSYTLTALAMDDRGFYSTSAPVSIQILNPDVNAPFVTITSAPANGSRLTSPQVSLAGTAGGNAGIDRVEVQVNGNPSRLASGTTNWNAQLFLSPGKNVLQVRSVDGAGTVSSEVTRLFTCVVLAPLIVHTNGLGRVTPDLNGRMLEIGRPYTVRAIQGPGQAFAGWIGVDSQSSLLHFTMQSNLMLVANFVLSPFPPVKGRYAGLMANTNGVLPENSGCFTIAMTASGLFTGKLFVGGKGHGFRGLLDLAGDAAVAVKRGKLKPLSLALHVDLTNGTDQITGFVTDGGWASELAGDRNIFNVKSNPAPQAGSRAFILERADNTSVTAAIGSSAISRSGLARVRGRLDNGKAFSAGSLLARNGDYPFYLSLSRGNEIVVGWLNFPAATTPTASGTVLWVRTGTNAFAATLRAASAP
jgi:hypothetical protein